MKVLTEKERKCKLRSCGMKWEETSSVEGAAQLFVMTVFQDVLLKQPGQLQELKLKKKA